MSRNKREGLYFGRAELWDTKIGMLRVTGTTQARRHRRASTGLRQWYKLCRENQLDWT